MKKLEDLKTRIKNFEKQKSKKSFVEKHSIKLSVSPLAIIIEIIAGILVGLFIGHYLDKFFGFKFLFKIICCILAYVATMISIYRSLTKSDNPRGNLRKGEE